MATGLPYGTTFPSDRVRVDGALHLEENERGLRPRRLPAWTRARTPHPFVDVVVEATAGVRIGTTFRGRDAAELHTLVAHLRAALPGLLGEHHVRPVIDSVVDLTTAEDAAKRLTEPGLTGKVVLRVARP
ncbi:hypothetical protein [Streptomyces niveus]|uniref:hypothetical protein n=1 Tax=Streptomyces niveus TaxID=193462 RepID=UPI0036615EA1